MQCNDRALIRNALLHLKRNDVVLADVIDRVGHFKIRPRLPLFDGLVSTIISQQLGEAAARALYGRFQDHYGKKSITPSLVDDTELG